MRLHKKGTSSILKLVFILFTLFLIFSLYTVKNLTSKSELSLDLSKNKDDSIGVIEVKGIIFESTKIVENLITAEKNKNIKAIIVRIDSPGGAVAPTQEIYEEIRRIDKIKPVYASFGTVAASGGYYIGAAARRIYASAGTLTGSIGVIMQFTDLSKLYEFIRINPSVIKSGQFKDIGNPSRALTAKEKELMQDMITGVHKQFINDILKNRKKVIAGNIYDHAQGQIFSGEGALKIGLVDRLGSLWSAGREIHEELKLKGELKLQYIKQKKTKFPISDFFDYVDDAATFLKGIISFSKVPLLLHNTTD
ncbi:MAG: signal peptide peptidase SppA [Oligoflexia bacterium]|nr:signal peptide peptidase SppA [Oligoflexia bacterium]